MLLRKTTFVLILLAIIINSHLQAQQLRSIDPPGGGKIMYGQVAGQSTEAGAMAYILRNLHQSLGEKPKVGKLFTVRNTQSVAAFFSVSRHDQGQGKQPLQIAGMIIAAKVSTDHVEAALLSDEAARFPKTLPAMQKTLFAQWRPLQTSHTGSASTASGAPAAQLHTVTLSDNSASVGLPNGWQIEQKMSGGGTLIASGPNGAAAELGITWLVGDTNNPMTQHTLAQLRAGYLRGSMYAQMPYYPLGADPGKTFEYLINHTRKRANLPAATYTFTTSAPVQAPNARCAHLAGSANFNNGKGPYEFNGLFCEQPPASGSYLTYATMTIVPETDAARERATLGAILQSFQVNQAVVQRQANQIAAPVVAQIHAIGQAAMERARASNEAFEIHNSSVYQHWDSMDKRSQEFSNYQLGYSVISTTDNTAHGTFWNEDADALVKSHPDKFEYVNAPDYWKGIDY
ncbi:MAG TPA: hypothetical protein VIM62_04500 [Acidobacteriaceae bacterium]